MLLRGDDVPELPEVETMVRGIRPHVAGRTLVAVRRCRCRLKPIQITPSAGAISRRVRGRRVTAVRRVGKRVVLDLESGDSFVIEPRMTGLMLVTDPPDRGHLRYHWQLSSAAGDDREALSDLWFWDRRGLGTVGLYSADELVRRLGPPRLGPDVLELRTRDWSRLCRRTGRAIKVALLDQGLAAGIGNLYASEILFSARIDPAHPANRLDDGQVTRLARATRDVLRTAIRHEGSTLSDGTYRNALNQDGRYQNSHRVYDRADQPCVECGAPIVRIVQAQRSTFFCPACQDSLRQEVLR